MLIQTPSKIYKADFRNWISKESYAITEIINEDKIMVHEVLIEKNGKFSFDISPNKILILLPIFGIIHCKGITISANEVLVISQENKNVFFVENTLTQEMADIVLIEINAIEFKNIFYYSEIDIVRNAIKKISNRLPVANYIGIYDGREEGFYPLSSPNNQIFCMVINGAFEIQNRLLETRDAIVLSEIKELEYEALSENSILLFIEI